MGSFNILCNKNNYPLIIKLYGVYIIFGLLFALVHFKTDKIHFLEENWVDSYDQFMKRQNNEDQECLEDSDCNHGICKIDEGVFENGNKTICECDKNYIEHGDSGPCGYERKDKLVTFIL